MPTHTRAFPAHDAHLRHALAGLVFSAQLVAQVAPRPVPVRFQ